MIQRKHCRQVVAIPSYVCACDLISCAYFCKQWCASPGVLLGDRVSN